MGYCVMVDLFFCRHQHFATAHLIAPVRFMGQNYDYKKTSPLMDVPKVCVLSVYFDTCNILNRQSFDS